MRIYHNFPFLYVLIYFVFNVFYIKLRYYPYNLVLSNKRRFVLLSGGSEVQVLFGVPTSEAFTDMVSGVFITILPRVMPDIRKAAESLRLRLLFCILLY